MTDTLDGIGGEIRDALTEQVGAAVSSALSGVLKGDPGDPGPPGAPGHDGVSVAFPSWLNNGHFGTGWTALSTQLTSLKTRLAGLPKPSGAKIVLSSQTFPGANTNSYVGIVRMAEADSYFLIPYSATSAYIYRRKSNSFAAPAGSYFGTQGQSGGCLMDSGRIALAPYQSGSLVAFNPYSEAIDTLQSGLTGTYKYNGCAKGKDGKIAFAPHNAVQAAWYDEHGSGWHLATGAFPGAYSYAGAIPLPNGKVLFVPHNAAKAAVLDLDTGAVTFGASIFPAAESFVGGALIDDNTVILFPHKYDRPVVYNFTSDTITAFPTAIGTLGTANFRGGEALPDGRFFITPFQSTAAKIIDLSNNSVLTLPGTYGSGITSGAALMDDGDVLMAPFNGTNALVVSTGYGMRLDPELVTSPHWARS